MDNKVYLESIGVTDPSTQQACLEAMEKYGDNHWWELDEDPRKFAYYQLKEERLLAADFGRFKEAMDLLLGRPVFTHEFRSSNHALRQEAERAWTYQVGVTSEAERLERLQESIDDFHRMGKERGIRTIQVNLPSEEE